jgi:hypothetical protein
LPWSKTSREEIDFYMDVLRKIGAKKIKSPEKVKREMLIRGEVLRRNFTKRQMNILSFLMAYSLYLGKERAIIPKMRDFEIAGVGKDKIRKELDRLVELNVLDWNQEEKSFAVKDPWGWKVKYHSGYNHERGTELFLLNLSDLGIDIDE